MYRKNRLLELVEQKHVPLGIHRFSGTSTSSTKLCSLGRNLSGSIADSVQPRGLIGRALLNPVDTLRRSWDTSRSGGMPSPPESM